MVVFGYIELKYKINFTGFFLLFKLHMLNLLFKLRTLTYYFFWTALEIRNLSAWTDFFTPIATSENKVSFY